MSDTNVKVLPPLKVEHYQDEHGDWRWRAIAPEDGLLMANGGQGYTHEQDCINGAKRVTHIESVLNPDIS